MTKEELETDYKDLSIRLYKRVSELETRCNELFFQVNEKIAKISELEAQIEKMKRCDMCKYSTRLGYCKIRQQGGVCENRNKWELDNLGENEND